MRSNGSIPSLAKARKTMQRAWAELLAAEEAMGKGKPVKLSSNGNGRNGHRVVAAAEVKREAAEKAWRAAREATYSVMRSRGKKTGHGTMQTKTVRDFETTVLGRSQEQPLADGYSAGISELHGACFYGDACPTFPGMKNLFSKVEKAIDRAEADIRRPRR